MQQSVKFLLVCFTASILASCVTKIVPINDANGKLMNIGSTVYTLTNLRADTKSYRIYSLNMQSSTELIPRCTAVTVLAISEDRDFDFSLNGVPHTYRFSHNIAPDGYEANLQKYFGTKCDASAVQKLSAIDQKGIKEGKAFIGMSKQGVLYAIGYPPSFETSTKASAWKYWFDKKTFIHIEFDDSGIVRNVSY